LKAPGLSLVVIRLESPEYREYSVLIRPDTPECKPLALELIS